jgi:hypothetical protein
MYRDLEWDLKILLLISILFLSRRRRRRHRVVSSPLVFRPVELPIAKTSSSPNFLDPNNVGIKFRE